MISTESTNIIHISKKCFRKIWKTSSAFKRQFLYLQQMLRGGANEEACGKHWRNTDFECFLVCVPMQHRVCVPMQHRVLKTQSLPLGSKSVLLSSCLLIRAKLWVTLIQNVSAEMFSRFAGLNDPNLFVALLHPLPSKTLSPTTGWTFDMLARPWKSNLYRKTEQVKSYKQQDTNRWHTNDKYRLLWDSSQLMILPGNLDRMTMVSITHDIRHINLQ